MRAEAGLTLRKFNQLIARHGLALPNLPAMDEMSLAGIVCTASHGTGHTGTLSSFITEIELITADGNMHTLSPQQDSAAFDAACVSLGSLGVIYSLTFQCEKLYKLYYHQKKMSLDELLSQYKNLYERTDFFQFRWDIRSNGIVGDFWSRTDPKTNPSETINSSYKYSYETLPFDTNSDPCLAAEISLPIDQLPLAIKIMQQLTKKWDEHGLGIEEVVGRFSKADPHGYLSPAADYEVVYLNIWTTTESKNEEVYRDFEEYLYRLRGRPHWGKVHFLNYRKAVSLYGHNLTKFIDVKKHLDLIIPSQTHSHKEFSGSNASISSNKKNRLHYHNF